MKKGDKMTYRELHKEAMKPLSERKKTVVGQDGEKRAVRRHCISDSAAKKLRSQKGFPNPYKRGSYFAIVQALIVLGPNKWHTFDKVKASVKKVMSGRKRFQTVKGKKIEITEWDKFANREARNANTGKDLNGRLMQNIEVLQRISGNHPYGEKLRQLFACIDIDADKKGLPVYRLNTKFRNYTSVAPINNLRRKPKAKTAQPAKATKKPSKPKTKVKRVSKPAKSVKAKAKRPAVKKNGTKAKATQKKAPAKVAASAK